MGVRKDRTGEKKLNNFGSQMVITQYFSCYDMNVYFPQYNWMAEQISYNNFKAGRVLCPYERRIHGIGYIGEGKHDYYVNGQPTVAYRKWKDMLQRCYDEKMHKKYPTYKDCSVCEEWHNFQNFAQWCGEHYYEIEGDIIELDKDILFKNNKIYSPNTCVFVPHNINVLFVKSNKARGDTPIGVHKRTNTYQVKCNNGKGKYVHVGMYENPIKAFEEYKKYKEQVIKNIANEYKELIPQELYNAMCNYQVNIND